MSLRGGAFDVALCLLDGSLGVNLCDLPILLTLALGLSDVTAELGLGDVDSGLVGGALMSLAREGFEVG